MSPALVGIVIETSLDTAICCSITVIYKQAWSTLQFLKFSFSIYKETALA